MFVILPLLEGLTSIENPGLVYERTVYSNPPTPPPEQYHNWFTKVMFLHVSFSHSIHGRRGGGTRTVCVCIHVCTRARGMLKGVYICGRGVFGPLLAIVAKQVWMGCECQSFEWDIVNRFWLIHDDDWTLTKTDAKIDSPIFHTWGLKSIH